ncbi:hypothetical protein NMY22_g1834 [Coprinellus aureogranulatus]|nr:hypothetical protein NMY22_g1834 [Coprinellus aureogranulatus]
MTPYLHFHTGDYLYFAAWKPSSPGAIVGACIGLFLLALLERWFAALRAVFEHHWKHRALLLSSRFSARSEGPDLLASSSRTDQSSTSGKREKELEASTTSIPPLVPRYRARTIPPFVPSQDIPRGILYAFHMFLGYLLMLAVMTFHAGFIISIVVGLGVGETAFGRAFFVLPPDIRTPLVQLFPGRTAVQFRLNASLFGWLMLVLELLEGTKCGTSCALLDIAAAAIPGAGPGDGTNVTTYIIFAGDAGISTSPARGAPSQVADCRANGTEIRVNGFNESGLTSAFRLLARRRRGDDFRLASTYPPDLRQRRGWPVPVKLRIPKAGVITQRSHSSTQKHRSLTFAVSPTGSGHPFKAATVICAASFPKGSSLVTLTNLSCPRPASLQLPRLPAMALKKIFTLRRKEVPWEVVDNKFVDPSPTYYGDEELDLEAVSKTDIKGTYVFDMKHGYAGIQDLQKALTFSRKQLMGEATRRGYNVLLVESWQLTIFQKAKQRRVEIRYSGRPARCIGEAPSAQTPPFIGILYA